MQRFYRWRWWTVALRGVAAILLGIMALVAPTIAFVSLVIAFGVYAIVDGVLAFGFASRLSKPLRTEMIIRGLVSILAGALALTVPKVTALTLLILIAAWAIVSGIVEIAMAIHVRKEIKHEWLLVLEGALSIGFGVLLIMSPLAGAVVLGLWVGCYALILGGAMISTAFRLRRELHEHGGELLPAAA